MDKIWKPIEGYDGKYMVSNLGEVKAMWRSNQYGITYKEHILSSYLNANYYRVGLSNDGKRRNEYVHRLVAQAFLPNPDNLPQVNHKDENTTNNFVFINPDGTVDHEKSNLEWCTASYNSQYGTVVKRRKEALPSFNKKVYQCTKQGKVVRVYDNIYHVSEENPVFSYKHIASVLRKDKYRHSAYNYKWYYEAEERSPQELLDALEALFEECGDEDK